MGLERLAVPAAIVSIVAFLEGVGFLFRTYSRNSRGVHRRQKSLQERLGGACHEVLPVPAGYEALQCGKQSNTDIEGLNIGPRLGYGSYGVVYHGRWRGARVAVKLLTHDKGDQRLGLQIAREVTLAAALQHPNIVHVFSVSTSKVVGAHGDNLETAIVMEYCDRGTLLDRHKEIWQMLKDDRLAALCWIKSTLLDIAAGVDYMHEKEIIHGDVRGFRCKIADMGCSRLLPITKDAIKTGSYGAPSHAAPELLKDGDLTKASDVYAFAVIAWHLVSLGDHFFSKNIGELFVKIVDLNARPPFPVDTNTELKALVEECWKPSSAERLSIGNVLSRLQSWSF